MIKTKLCNCIKLFWLFFSRVIRKLFKHIGFNLSLIFVLLSFFISLFFLVPSLFSRVPVFSYLIDTLSLPLSYEFDGRVNLVNSDGTDIYQPVNIYIGGYNVQSISGEQFTIKFSSESTEFFYINIEYEDATGKDAIITKRIETNGETKLSEVISINV